jgi:hypothetical protein
MRYSGEEAPEGEAREVGIEVERRTSLRSVETRARSPNREAEREVHGGKV